MTSGGFKDHFSGHAAHYARARPVYPSALYDFLAGLCERRELAWDCATGNGQAAAGLSRYFDRVVATDASEAQIREAQGPANVDFHVASAEASGLADASVDLLSVAQALHWFDLERFFAEAARVLAPGGVLAAWCYGTCHVAEPVDRVVHGYYEALDAWWPPEREIVERGYADIELPFAALDVPAIAMHVDWQASDMLAYIDTWSASARCRAATGRDPLDAVRPALSRAWGSGTRRVHWPLYLKASRKA